MASNPIEFPPSNLLRVEVENFDEHRLIVTCHGKLIRETSDELTRAVKPLMVRGKHIALDLGDVSQIDSSGFGALLALRASAVRARMRSIELCRAGALVKELLRVTKTLSAFDWPEEEYVKEPGLEQRRELKIDELSRNPDARFAEED